MQFLIEEGFAHDLESHSPVSHRIGVAAATKSDLGY
jgi:hypothetical protein